MILRKRYRLRGAIARRMREPVTACHVIRQIFAEIERRGVSQRSVALAAGIAPASLSQYKAGVSTPSAMTLEAIAQVLGKTVVLRDVRGGRR